MITVARMKLPVLAVFMFLAACPPCAYSCLGESSAQIEARYGAAIGTRKDDPSRVVTRYYLHDGLGISVKFLEGKSQCETYLKADNAAMSGQEITAILKANALGSDWLSVYQSADTGRWELKSRVATAVYSRSRHSMEVETKEFVRSGTRITTLDPSAN